MWMTLLLLLGTAIPNNWIRVASAKDTVTYIDIASIKEVSPKKITVWVRRQNSRPDRERVLYRIAKVRYDCAEETSTLLAVTNYDDGDQVLIFTTFRPGESDTSPQSPGSVGLQTLQTVCAGTS